MQSRTEWVTGIAAWADFVKRHPELGYLPGKWGFHNFLRHYKRNLIGHDAIRFAKRRFWVAHIERFVRVSFDCATGREAAGIDTSQGGDGAATDADDAAAVACAQTPRCPVRYRPQANARLRPRNRR